ncbi:MarR family winged helix-turn-helix transcriptional regulator [Winogradskya humida]|uniref:MarR family transcriptional regulator n=1 Tax=Winogradskya humida TaxID=113566 RepID=A0ABQ3ZSR0_9ACTN|nr:MarR family transcriptional regulator [Actinoplanes humidus]GIE21631.1 MarR family transcriptional regulator [Actinoplanes humidus]
MADSQPLPDTADVAWLTESEQEAWRQLLRVLLRLPSAFDGLLRQADDLVLVEYNVMAFLSEAPGRSLKMTAIAAEADLSPSRLSHLIGRLEKRGWVLRHPATDDKRVIMATLTAEGYASVQRLAPRHVRDVRELVFDRLTAEQVDQLSRIAAAIAAR